MFDRSRVGFGQNLECRKRNVIVSDGYVGWGAVTEIVLCGVSV
jgi:hypothetical protein